jgi:glutamyl-tRNA reductase
MSVLALGLNHTTAALDLRGKFAFSVDQISPALRQFSQHLHTHVGHAAEAALLSTCNRTELYCTVPNGLEQHAHDTHEHMLTWLAKVGQVSPQVLREHIYVHENGLAARHAFRVASGLDSMVLGEPQILGQMKQAVRQADEAGTLGSTLHQMFQRSFSVAKEVRSSTDIGAHSVSMAAAAVRLAEQIFERMADTRVLFVGAGDMIELCATHFAAQTPRFMAVANRTLARGEHLANKLGGQAIGLADMPQRLHEFDIVISCTASTLPIIGLGAVERAIKLRKHRPMFMLDLAVPRDIEPEVGKLPDAYVYTVDDLSQLVQTSGNKRQAAVAQAEVIIDTGVQSFVQWLDQRSHVPLIQALHAQADAWREQEMAKARKHLSRGQPVDDVLQSLSRGLTQKMLHGAMAELHSADAQQRQAVAEWLTRLFLREDDHSLNSPTQGHSDPAEPERE